MAMPFDPLPSAANLCQDTELPIWIRSQPADYESLSLAATRTVSHAMPTTRTALPATPRMATSLPFTDPPPVVSRQRQFHPSTV